MSSASVPRMRSFKAIPEACRARPSIRSRMLHEHQVWGLRYTIQVNAATAMTRLECRRGGDDHRARSSPPSRSLRRRDPQCLVSSVTSTSCAEHERRDESAQTTVGEVMARRASQRAADGPADGPAQASTCSNQPPCVVRPRPSMAKRLARRLVGRSERRLPRRSHPGFALQLQQ